MTATSHTVMAVYAHHERIADITTGSPLRMFKPEHYLECTAVPTGPTPESGC